jgi:uncharacterized protein (DUF885 family)
MRRSWKFGIILLLIASGFWLVRLLFLRPLNIDHFFERTFLLYSLESPEYLSSSRLLDRFGITSHRKHLDDASIQCQDRLQRFLKQTEETFRAYDRAALNEEQALSYDIFAWHLRSLQNANGPWRFHNYPLNQFNGVQNRFPAFMQDVHVVSNRDEARDYVARLYAVKDKFDQLLESLQHRQKLGIVPPDFVLDQVLKDMRAFVAVPMKENVLYRSLEEKLQLADGIKEKDRDVYREGAEAAMRDAVYPAYAKLIAYVEDLRRTASSDAGVWKWPQGDAYYRYILSEHTTLDLDPEAVHQLGLAEVARIQQELSQLLETEGFAPGQALQVKLEALAQDPRFHYPDDDNGREQILKDYQSIIEEARQSLGAYFHRMPSLPVLVKPAPVLSEASGTAGYYQSPSLDGKRPGVFYANLGDIKNTAQYAMRSLAYHETIPGHHLQTALRMEMEDLPLFRREGGFTVFAEGWGLYAERLAFEAGLEKNPMDSIGRLKWELLRAARLVVDTGLHAKRWTREQAIDYLQTQGGIPQEQAVNEVDRYVVFPGQACAYMMGMHKFLELRNKVQATLRDKFDIKAFHQLILENGAMPLAILEQRVERWMSNQR